MHRVDHPTRSTSLPPPDPPPATPGYFRKPDATLAIPATIVPFDFMNALQEEVLAPIEAAGLVPDKGSTTQLLQAIARFSAAGALGNVLLNGDFRIWQRRGPGPSLSVTNTLGFQGPDRWLLKSGNAGATLTIGRNELAFATEISPSGAGIVLDWNKTVAGGAGEVSLIQRIERVETLQAQRVVVAFDARKAGGSDLGILSVELVQSFGSGGSSAVATALAASAGLTIDSSWRRLVFTGTLPSVVGKTVGTGNYLELRIKFAENTASHVYLTAFVVSRGVADPGFFSRPLADEIALCQRYYEKSQRTDSPPGSGAGTTGSQLGPWDTGWDGFASIGTLRTRLTVEKYGASGAATTLWYSTLDGALDTVVEDGGTARAVTSAAFDQTYAVQPTLTSPPASGTVHSYRGRWVVRAEIGTET